MRLSISKHERLHYGCDIKTMKMKCVIYLKIGNEFKIYRYLCPITILGDDKEKAAIIIAHSNPLQHILSDAYLKHVIETNVTIYQRLKK